MDKVNAVEETTKKYEFRKLISEDMFTLISIISKIGVNKFAHCFNNEEIKELAKDLKGKKKDDEISDIVGGKIFLEVAQVILEGMNKCKDDVYKLLSDTSNLSIEELKALESVTFLEMIIDFVKKEEFMDFIKAASKFVK